MLFRELGRAPRAGALSIGGEELLLEGGVGEKRSRISIHFGELSEIRVARALAERLNGHPVIVLERSSSLPVHIAPLTPGLLP